MSDFLQELYEWSTGTASPVIAASANPPLAASATFYNSMPETPVSCLAFYHIGGRSFPHNPIVSNIIRVLARGTDRAAALDLANQAYKLFHTGMGSVLINQDIGDYWIYDCVARSMPQGAGKDVNGYPQASFDMEVFLREV